MRQSIGGGGGGCISSIAFGLRQLLPVPAIHSSSCSVTGLEGAH